MKDIQYKNFGSLYKIEDKEGIKYIKGHASAFGNVDSHGDIVAKGAFTKSIQNALERKINLFSSHSMDARDLVGSITSMREDSKGLLFEAAISQAPSAQDIAIKAAEGHLNEVSIGFYIVDEEELRDEKTNKTIRHIKEIELVEISLVSRASNAQATLLEVRNENLDNKPKEVIMSEENKTNEAELKALELQEKMLKKMEELENAISKAEARANKLPEVSDAPEAKKEEIEFELKSEDELDMFAAIVCTRNVNAKNAAVNKYLETKLASNIDADGGLTVPTALKEKIIQKKEQLNKVSDLVSKEKVNGPVSLLDFDFSETLPDVDEGAANTIEEVSDAFGKSILDPQDFGIIVKVSDRLARRSFLNMQNFLAQRYARKDRAQLDGHLLTGTGSKEPLGILTFMDDVNSGNQITSVTGGNINTLIVGDLIDLEMELAEEYRANAVFVASPAAMKILKKLEDTAGTRVWQRALEAGAPSTLLGYPIIESVSMDDGTSAGDQPILFGDMSMYFLAEEIEFNVEVLDNYRPNGQVGLKFSRAYDGMPIDKNAFASIKVQA